MERSSSLTSMLSLSSYAPTVLSDVVPDSEPAREAARREAGELAGGSISSQVLTEIEARQECATGDRKVHGYNVRILIPFTTMHSPKYLITSLLRSTAIPCYTQCGIPAFSSG